MTFDETEAARIDAGTHYVAQGWNTAAGLLAEFNTLNDLGSVDTSTLAVGGKHDFITPPEPGAVRLGQQLPNAEVAVFENSGHYPFIEQEQAIFERLRQFLSIG